MSVESSAAMRLNNESRRYASVRRELTTRVKVMIVNALNMQLSPEEIEDDAPLFGAGLGLDSLDALEIAVAFELEFGISTGEAGHKVFRSVNSIVDFVMASGH